MGGELFLEVINIWLCQVAERNAATGINMTNKRTNRVTS